MNDGIKEFMIERGWTTAAEIPISPQNARFGTLDPAVVGDLTVRYAARQFKHGLYQHQVEAITSAARGGNVCLATGTASGKTALFHAAAIRIIGAEHKSKVLCLYPMKALASEQETRWQNSLKTVFSDARVCRIDGSVPMKQRDNLLRSSHIAVMTPDVVHAWLLPKCGSPVVRQFLSRLKLVVVDEAHAYTGVFGSNSAFLFRRLRHICSILGTTPQFVAASATISNPFDHLQRLTGRPFTIVDEASNGSARQPVQITLARPPEDADAMSTLTELLAQVALDDHSRFIAFLDSRKQVELVASIMARHHDEALESEQTELSEPAIDATMDADSSEPDDEVPPIESSLRYLNGLSVLPYRAGYEEVDRHHIQARLSAGTLRGVVSTSALELGIDVAGLDTAVLLGVPASSTSLKQRIGRIGRHKPGHVLIVHSGSVLDDAVFAAPERLLSRPPAESALYLENPRIQYIHALCLARLGGEHDQASSAVPTSVEASIKSEVEWPSGFLTLAQLERSGQVPGDLQAMKEEAGDFPHYVYPLRDVEAQFKAVMKRGPEEIPFGSLSYSQCLREAYPGAIYRYATRPFRVYSVGVRSREVRMRPDKAYVTKPTMLPTLVFPNLRGGNVFRAVSCAELMSLECNLQVREWVGGFTERRGATETTFTYPLHGSGSPVQFDQSAFFRNYFTTGVVLLHPAMSKEGVNREALHKLLLESLLLYVPFERTDIRSASDKLRIDWGESKTGQRFACIYDSTYGSLRLSGRLLDHHVLEAALQAGVDLAVQGELDAVTIETMQLLASAPKSGIVEIDVSRLADGGVDGRDTDDEVRVILEGSSGLLLLENNQEFWVEKIYWHPRENCLYYRGRPRWLRAEVNQMVVPVNRVAEIPGESKMGYYSPASGDIRSE